MPQKKIVCISIIVLFFSFSKSYSQEIETPKQQQFIVLTNGYIIKNIEIFKSFKKTNEDFISYKDSLGSVKKLTVKEVQKYFDGIKLFNSVKINNEDYNKFISYFSVGYINIGESYSESGYPIYWFKKDDKLSNLEDHKTTLQKFFSENIEKFDEFMKSYNSRIKYSYKSLGEFASTYNSFRFPKKYVPVKYEHKKSLSIGVNLNPIIFSSFGPKQNRFIDIKNSYQLSFSMVYMFKENSSFTFDLGLYKSIFINEETELYLNSLSSEISFNNPISKRFKISPGIAFNYHYDSYTKIIDNLGDYVYSYVKSPINAEIFVKVQYELIKNIYLTGSIHNYNIKINTISYHSINTNIEKLNIFDFRFGISYLFKL